MVSRAARHGKGIPGVPEDHQGATQDGGDEYRRSDTHTDAGHEAAGFPSTLHRVPLVVVPDGFALQSFGIGHASNMHADPEGFEAAARSLPQDPARVKPS